MLQGSLGKYELVRFLAKGGMADVYLARERGRDREVAIKVLDAASSADAGTRAMFYMEARLAAWLQHPNLAAAYEVACEDGIDYLAMEYVDGADLRQVLAAGVHVPYDVAVAIVMQAAAGLDHAHRRCSADGKPLHLVHRDVSPSNLMVTRDGRVKVIDFGIARASFSTQVTNPGTVRGKPSYMSPEQVTAGQVDLRSDVFALGIVLYELATGEHCFEGPNDFERMYAIARGAFAAPRVVIPGFPEELERVILTALAVDPARRYASAAALCDALAAVARTYNWAADAAALSRIVPDVRNADVDDLEASTVVMRIAQHLAA